MPKLTIDGKEVEVPAGTNLIEAARQAGVEVPALLLSPRASASPASAGCAWWTSRRSRARRSAATRRRPTGMVVHTQTERVLETPQVGDGVPPRQPPAGLPGVRPGGRVLAADLLHAARALRPAHDRREGPQAEGGAARAPRHARRRALHPVLALRALLRRGDQDGRARHLQPRRPLRDRPRSRARRSRTSTRATSSTSARWARSPTATSASRCASGTSTRPSRSARVRARLQHRGAHQPAPAAPQPGPAARPAQAALQRRRQPVVDVRRGPLRLRLGRRRQPADRAPLARGGDRRSRRRGTTPSGRWRGAPRCRP